MHAAPRDNSLSSVHALSFRWVLLTTSLWGEGGWMSGELFGDGRGCSEGGWYQDWGGFHIETLVIYQLSSRKFTTQNDLY